MILSKTVLAAQLLREFIEEYYHAERPHLGLAGNTPIPRERPANTDGPMKLVLIPIPVGLHLRYERVAAQLSEVERS